MRNSTSDGPDPGELYRGTRRRITELVSSLRPDDLAAPVPACPGWSVSDVVSHIAAGTEDVLAGRLAGPPTDDQTAAQVARHRGKPISEVVGLWTTLAPQLETMISAANAWTPVLDAVSHEHDIRGAIGRPGGRDSPAVYHGAEALCARAALPRLIRVVWENGEGRMGPDGVPELVLRTSRFETLRWRLGRRSRGQMEQLDWSANPHAVLDHLPLFGPARQDLIE